MKLNTSQTAQTTPLFFNCTESPIPIPTQNYLSGIQGVKPLTLAEAPELAPPPTDIAGVGVTGTPGLRSRQRRPDALYKDSVSASASQPAHSEQGQYQGQVAAQHNYDSADYSTGVQYGSPGQYQNPTQFDNAVQYNAQYPGGSNYDTYSHQYTDYQYQYGYDTNYSQEYHAPSHSHVHADVLPAFQTPENSFTQHDYTTHHHHQPTHVGQFTGDVTYTEPSRTSDTVLNEDKDETSQLESSQLDDALSKINDDFWGMGISVHTDDALS